MDDWSVNMLSYEKWSFLEDDGELEIRVSGLEGSVIQEGVISGDFRGFIRIATECGYMRLGRKMNVQ